MPKKYGIRRLTAAIRDTARKGGKSIAYVERILEDRASRPANEPADTLPRRTPPGRYAPTYDDINEVEAYLHSEWFDDWDDEEAFV